MRKPGMLVIAILAAACSSTPLASSEPQSAMPLPSMTPAASDPSAPSAEAVETVAPSAEPSAAPTEAPTPAPTATNPAPSATPDPSLVAVALDYARRAGFDLARDPDPKLGTGQPSFDNRSFTHVSLRLAGKRAGRLEVFLDGDGSIRAAERQEQAGDLAGSLSRAAAIDAAARAFRVAGVDPSSGTLHPAFHQPGSPWYITLDRRVAGHPVANFPMWWGIVGDHAYVELAADGRLVTLYAIRPNRRPVPTNVLDRGALVRHLARAAELSPARIDALAPDFLWIRRNEGEEPLSLDYCATDEQPLSWQTWCVDPVTGDLTAMPGAVTDVGPTP